jgi:gluconokinase
LPFIDSMTYYLGVDIGTTAAKAVAFSETGEVLAVHSSYFEMQHPHDGWSEQDPDELMDGVITAIRTVVDQLAPAPPVFVSFSAAMHSLIAVDEGGFPLTSAIIWADNRAAGIAAALRASEKGTAFYHATGVPIHPMSPLCKILWLKEQDPGLFKKAARFISIKEYVFYRLLGTYVVDSSIASTTGLLNLRSLDWDPELLSDTGIALEQLSPVVPPTYALRLGRTLFGPDLQAGVPIVLGGSDGALANLGSGAMEPHTLAVSIGTSSAIRRVVQAPQTDVAMRSFCYHLMGNNYVVGGASNNGAVVLQWVKESLLQTEESYEALLAGAETVAPGSEGLIFAPYLLGERAPLWDPSARGVFMGLGIQHTRSHLVRAALEGVIYCLYSIGKPLLADHRVTELRVSGGFARRALPLQVLADVFNTQVRVSASVEASARGAVLVGAKALGIDLRWEDEVSSVYSPRRDAHEVYRRRMEVFEQIPGFLKTIQ